MRAIFTNQKHKLTEGFTVVELVVVMTVMSVLSVIVFGALGDYYQDNLISVARTTQDTDVRSVLLTIGNDLSDSVSFLPALPASSIPVLSTLTAPLGYYNNGGTLANQTGGWSYLGLGGVSNTNARVLIATKYATDKSPSDPTYQPLFVQTNGLCDPFSSQVSMAQVGYVYYMAKDPTNTSQYNLYRRIVLPAAGTVYCRGGFPYLDTSGNPGKPWQKQSCAPNTTPLLDPSGLCRATDAILLRNITAFSVGYYRNAYETTTHIPPVAVTDTAAQLTATVTRTAQGKSFTSTATVRISR